MLSEIPVEDYSRALDETIDELLATAKVMTPPIDALQVATALGIVVASDDRQAGRVVFGIGRHHHGDHLGFVHETLGEQGAYRPVNQPAGEDFLLRRASFTLDEASRNLSGGIRVLAIIDG